MSCPDLRSAQTSWKDNFLSGRTIFASYRVSFARQQRQVVVVVDDDVAIALSHTLNPRSALSVSWLLYQFQPDG